MRAGVVLATAPPDDLPAASPGLLLDGRSHALVTGWQEPDGIGVHVGPAGVVARGLPLTPGSVLEVEGHRLQLLAPRSCVPAPGLAPDPSLEPSTTWPGLPPSQLPAPLRGRLRDPGDGLAVRPVGLELEVSRPPRLAEPETLRRVRLPEQPATVAGRKLPLVPLLLPVVIGVVMALLSSPLFLLLTLAAPLSAGATWWSDRRAGRSASAAAHVLWRAATQEAEAEVARRVAQETADRHRRDPSSTEVAGWSAPTPSVRLWERRRYDDDALVLRVGVGPARCATVHVEGDEQPVLDAVPVTVDLRAAGVLGLAGPRDAVEALARAVLVSACGLHPPGDLSLVLLADPARDSSSWAWTRWLPHLGGPGGRLQVGLAPAALAERTQELVALVEQRTAAARDVRRALAARADPDVLVVLDGGRVLRPLPGITTVLRDGPAVGVHVLCVDAREHDLPEECGAVVVLGSPRTGGNTGGHDGVSGPADEHALAAVTVDGGGTTAVRPDALGAELAEHFARGLAPLREVRAAARGELPDALRLLDLLDLSSPTADAIRERWAAGAQAWIGVDADGPVAVDLLRDGPHALVAGTTGSGKSELLQTLVASLAATHPPEVLSFVLVDYKGGAAFRDCARLPHTVGMVTDLDGHLVERALASLTAELRHREQRLATAQVKDLGDHLRAGSPGGALPRLVLVVDEFAALAEELPEFVRGLVGIAQRGRSLGVHLVLATQRPGSVVSPEIRANTDLRIALRVVEPAESTDVVDTPEAAHLPRRSPGRAVLRTGAGTTTTLQTARIGGRRPGVRGSGRERTATPVPWSRAGGPLPTAGRSAVEDDETDLRDLVEAVRGAAGATSLRPPWLPPLPRVVALTPAAGPSVPYGVVDLPDQQARGAAVLDLEQGGHLLVAGTARSGRTTLLRTLAASLASTWSADDLELVVLDGGQGGLAALARLPHCANVVGRGQPERAERLLARLAEEVAHRQEVLARCGAADLVEQRALGLDPLPWLVLLLDGWEGLLASWDDLVGAMMTDRLVRLLRDGAAVGLRVVVTGDRGVLVGKLPGLVQDVLCLRLADRGDYALAGLAPRSLPVDVPPGRGFRAGAGTVEAVQVCVLGDDPRPAAQSAALELLGAALPARRRATGRPPVRVDALPATLTLRRAAELPREAGVPVAVGGDVLTWLAAPLDAATPAFVVAGSPRSGRSCALLAAARSADRPVIALAPRPSPLRELPRCLVGPDLEVLAAGLADALNRAAGPALVVVDDAEVLQSTAVDDLLQQVLAQAASDGHALLLAGGTDELGLAFRGFVAEARRSRAGLLLCPDSHLQGELLGVRLPRSAVFSGPPGRGLLVLHGQSTLVQVPHPGPTAGPADAGGTQAPAPPDATALPTARGGHLAST